ncbi:flagellar hook-basal body protein [Oribacterium sp. WCC10]|uniref:flagellar hook-basal body protein n=1 Tax=Oribacterium sp. WCC10 TaxID=1855343 RepID=UPI0008F32CFE|nr:flagellar hook-basal body protein [Oribacterium sp. WCC10]SFG24777.1 flagellar basal-body rod protein FlgG [Oribacterium sp. WCC10]
MYQGFYNLTSGMLTQQRRLNVISNNMVNIQTAGYKKDTMTATTFQEEMLIRTGKYNKDNPTDLATTSKIVAADQTYTNYEQGAFEQTDDIYDFAIGGNGWFSIQTEGGVRYTRDGSFSVDQEGYLELNGLGRVLGADDQPIRIPTENFYVDKAGNIIVDSTAAAEKTGKADGTEQNNAANGTENQVTSYGQIKLVDFQDLTQLHKEDNGLYSTNQAATVVNGADGTQLMWTMLEKANVDMVDEMSIMISSQRALQGAAQMLKMYDSVMAKASSDVGRL